jgi:hypothetical protein
MKSRFVAFTFQKFAAFFGCMLISLSIFGSAHGAFFQKKFVVCQDQGRDVLCDSYVVKKNDFVTKLFKQRGEIAYRDWPKFLEIFKRLNPEVKNIDLIYPDQQILLPLKLIEPDTLEGQDSGTVTIPMITITNLPRQLQQNSMNYVVRQGDTVSALIAKKFGRYSTRSYKEGVKIFKYLNPQLKDLNFIHVGQTINLPVATVRDESWYPELFDDAGDLVLEEETADEVKEEPPVEVIEEVAEIVEVPPAPEVEAAVIVPVIEKAPDETIHLLEPVSVVAPPPEDKPEEKPEEKPEDKIDEPIEEKIEDKKPVESEKEKLPEPKPLTPLPSIFKKAAAIFNAELLDKGEYFFPRTGKEDLALNLAATPVMEFSSGLRILFAKNESLSMPDQTVVASFWKNLQIVTMSYDASLRELLYTICQLTDKNGCENTFSFDDQGLKANVRGEYIYDNPNGPGKICATLIDQAGQKMSNELNRYLAGQQLTVSEWIDGENFFGPVSVGAAAKPLPGYFIAPDKSQPSAFILDFAEAFGMKFQQNVEISFPYAGFQVKAYSNLLSVYSGKDFLVDFGDLQGDAIESIETTGFHVLQISAGQSRQSIVSDLLAVMPVSEIQDPVFWGADRARTYNASIQVPGRLITMITDQGKMKVLITDIPLHENVLSFLNRAGIKVMKIGNN